VFRNSAGADSPDDAGAIPTFRVNFRYGDKQAVLQELPGKFGGVMAAAVHPGGWRLVVIFAEKPPRALKEETRQGIRQTRQELSDILKQRAPD